MNQRLVMAPVWFLLMKVIFFKKIFQNVGFHYVYTEKAYTNVAYSPSGAEIEAD